MTPLAKKLQHHFQGQVTFAAAYSPLYARFFATCVDWLDQPGHPVMAWLLDVGQARNPFDLTLLLAAAVHRDVLTQEPAAQPLIPYYATAGGQLPPHAPELPALWQHTILARAEAYTPFIQTATVQTNETGRGLAWLWPLLDTGWSAVNLVDLGASAGLNLVGEQRAYRLVDKATGTVLADMGLGEPVQFITKVVNPEQLPLSSDPSERQIPTIVSRLGCDLHPFHLHTPEREHTLMAYVWGDQPQRLQRLKEGIAAWQGLAAAAPLFPVNLPDELPGFLSRIPHNEAPVLIYNTVMTMYLRENGLALRPHIAQWAQTQSRPVLWVQWEPLYDGPEPPESGWSAWQVDLWQEGGHHQWQLGWIHPHGTELQIEAGMGVWRDFWAGRAKEVH